MAATVNNAADSGQEEIIDVSGKKWDASKYHVDGGKIIENGTNRFVAWQDKNRLTTAAKREAQQQKASPEAQQQKANPETQQRKAAAGGAFKTIGQAAATAMSNATKPSPVSNPQAQHNARQASLAQNQAAQLRAQQQQANQIANRTSTTTGAMNEAQKVAEQSALQKQRLAAQQMVGDAGLANVAAAKAGAEVDPSQHFSEMQALGSQERQRAIELGRDTAAMQSTAEAQRAKTTAEVEAKQQAAAYNAKADALNAETAARDEARWQKDYGLRQKQVTAEAAKNEAEGNKAAAEGQISKQQADATTEEKSQSYEQQIRALLQRPTDPITIMSKYIALHNLDNNAGNAIMHEISKAIGPNSANKAVGEKALEYWRTNNPNAPQANVDYMTAMLSDRRMKNISTPVGKALINIWKGRTI